MGWGAEMCYTVPDVIPQPDNLRDTHEAPEHHKLVGNDVDCAERLQKRRYQSSFTSLMGDLTVHAADKGYTE